MVHLFNTFIDLGILVSGFSTVLEDTDGYAKQYRCACYIYLFTVLYYLYDIILYCEINSLCHGFIYAGGLNATDKIFLKGKM